MEGWPNFIIVPKDSKSGTLKAAILTKHLKQGIWKNNKVEVGKWAWEKGGTGKNSVWFSKRTINTAGNETNKRSNREVGK